jgi:transcriptional regulator with XRE-family HTH domain
MKNRGPGTDISTGRAKVVRPQAGPSNLALNLRRLVFFHHPTAKDAAGVIGVSEHAMSAWLTDKRKPGRDSLLRVAAIYDFDPRLLSGDPSPSHESSLILAGFRTRKRTSFTETPSARSRPYAGRVRLRRRRSQLRKYPAMRSGEMRRRKPYG